ncbi:FUSC family protein [Specibacter sp. NPDC057265]|uniref:FUSC family protein n=1 Tax=Specibacter sp. NPDC057265 TaxID=3346075 RepID=UPI0036369920
MMSAPRSQHIGAALAHAFSPAAWRGAFVLRPADAIFATAIKVGVAASIVLLAGGLLGERQLAGIAALGALTSAFGRYQPYSRLARMMAIVAIGMLVSIAVGALLGAAGVTMLSQIVLLSALAAVASHIFTAFRITGPGAVILVFAAGAGAGYTHNFAALPRPLIAMGIGVVVGWLAAMAPVLVVPLGPARLAVARALAAVRKPATDDAGPHRDAAATALRSARESVILSSGNFRRNSRRSQRLHHHARHLHALLNEAAAAWELGNTAHSSPAAHAALSKLADHEKALRRLGGIPVPGEHMPDASSNDAAAAWAEPPTFFAAALPGLGSASSMVHALRIAAAAMLSGWAAVGLGFDHPLWATMGAVAALQGMNYAMTVQRSIQRLVGNVVGAAVALVLLSLPLGFWPSVLLVVAFQVLAELLVLKNYTLTTIAVTPMALIMTGLGSALEPTAAISRVADTLVGVVIGTLVAAVSISLADRHHVVDTKAAALKRQLG